MSHSVAECRSSPGSPTLAGRWIESRLNSTTRIVQEAFCSYRLHEAADSLQSFFVRDYCDVFLELCKAENCKQNQVPVQLTPCS